MVLTTSNRIEKTVVLNAPIERVWRAISNAEEFGAWFGVKFTEPFKAGASLLGEHTDPAQHGRGLAIQVIAMEEPSRLAYRWRPHAMERPIGDASETTTVEFVLESRDGQTHLQIIESGFEAVPESQRESNFRENREGWDEQARRLAAYLAEAPVPDQIKKTITLNAPIERAWRAISRAAEFGAWFGIDFGNEEFVPGRAIKAKITKPPEYAGTEFDISIVELTTPTKLAFRWHPYTIDPTVDAWAQPATLIEFVLEPRGEKTFLTVTETGFDNIPEAHRASAFGSDDEGWGIQVTQVRDYLDG